MLSWSRYHSNLNSPALQVTYPVMTSSLSYSSEDGALLSGKIHKVSL